MTRGRETDGATDAPVVVLRDVTKRYGARAVLQDITLSLRGRQIVGVVGPDGAGKTTLLRLLAGLLDIHAAEARVLGYDLRGDVTALKRQIGYVPQTFSLNRDLSVIENLRFTARLHRLDAAVCAARADALLQRTELTPFVDRPAGALSGGMKQKLAIANALLAQPALLLLDEPTAGVDVVARTDIWTLLQEARRDTLVVMSTSYLDEAAACDRLLYLDAGGLVMAGTPAELRAAVPLELYRAWGDAPRGIAAAARALPYVAAARPTGRFAWVEVRRAHSPGADCVVRDVVAACGARFVEALPLDMEATLLHLARGNRP